MDFSLNVLSPSNNTGLWTSLSLVVGAEFVAAEFLRLKNGKTFWFLSSSFIHFFLWWHGFKFPASQDVKRFSREITHWVVCYDLLYLRAWKAFLTNIFLVNEHVNVLSFKPMSACEADAKECTILCKIQSKVLKEWSLHFNYQFLDRFKI